MYLYLQCHFDRVARCWGTRLVAKCARRWGLRLDNHLITRGNQTLPTTQGLIQGALHTNTEFIKYNLVHCSLGKHWELNP